MEPGRKEAWRLGAASVAVSGPGVALSAPLGPGSTLARSRLAGSKVARLLGIGFLVGLGAAATALGPKRDLIFEALFVMDNFIAPVLMVAGSVEMGASRRENVALLEEIDKLHASVGALGREVTYDKWHALKGLVFPFLLNEMVSFFLCFSTELPFPDNLVVIFCDLQDALVFFIISARFVTFLYVVRRLLEGLNSRLEDCFSGASSCSAPEVGRMAETHRALTYLLPRINSLYSFQMMITVSYIFLKIVFHAFFFIKELQAYGRTKHTQHLFTFFRDVPTILYTVIVLFVVLKACGSAKSKAEEFSEKLFDLLEEKKTLHENDKLFLHTVLPPEITFTAAGFFNLENAIVTSMVASMTTYITICLQINDGSSAPK